MLLWLRSEGGSVKFSHSSHTERVTGKLSKQGVLICVHGSTHVSGGVVNDATATLNNLCN